MVPSQICDGTIAQFYIFLGYITYTRLDVSLFFALNYKFINIYHLHWATADALNVYQCILHCINALDTLKFIQILTYATLDTSDIHNKHIVIVCLVQEK